MGFSVAQISEEPVERVIKERREKRRTGKKREGSYLNLPLNLLKSDLVFDSAVPMSVGSAEK